MIIGAHSIIYSSDPEADRAFLRDVLELTNVDVGEGWLIFGLPPAEVAVHPSDTNDVHELFLMCDDVEALVEDMSTHGIVCGPVQNRGWGLLTELGLPGGGKLGVYQPQHARPDVPGVRSPGKGVAKRTRRSAKPATRPATKRRAMRASTTNAARKTSKKRVAKRTAKRTTKRTTKRAKTKRARRRAPRR